MSQNMKRGPKKNTKKLFEIIAVSISVLIISNCSEPQIELKSTNVNELVEFIPPDTSSLNDDLYGRTVKYGLELMNNTPYYLGPKGIKGNFLGNEMTCTNCHLNAGAKTYGNSLYNTHKSYPQYRAREDKILTSSDRVNNCIVRPHSGKPMPIDCDEMIAIVTYMQWLGKDYNPDKHFGHGIKEIAYKGLKSNPDAGNEVYKIHCQSCHMPNGEGIFDTVSNKYTNPPLWGESSYQEGSSMHRVIKSASFIHLNMPNGTSSWEKPTLTIQEALDVAGFINSYEIHPRKGGNGISYPNLKTKPKDYFEGPYLDSFSRRQHTFGPWDEMGK
jgi:thiosulfate dehydrogenase